MIQTLNFLTQGKRRKRRKTRKPLRFLRFLCVIPIRSLESPGTRLDPPILQRRPRRVETDGAEGYPSGADVATHAAPAPPGRTEPLQTTPRAVSDLTFDTRLLPLGHDRKRVLLVEAGTPREVGAVFEEIQRTDDDGTSVVERVQWLESELLGPRRARLLADAATLAPLRLHLENPDGVHTLEYRAGAVRHAMVSPEGETTTVTEALPPRVFDAYAVELLLRALPLADGYTAELPVYVAQVGLSEVLVRVTAGEPIAHGDEVETAWRVEVALPPVESTYWVGMHSHTLLRQDTPLGPDALLRFIR